MTPCVNPCIPSSSGESQICTEEHPTTEENSDACIRTEYSQEQSLNPGRVKVLKASVEEMELSNYGALESMVS